MVKFLWSKFISFFNKHKIVVNGAAIIFCVLLLSFVSSLASNVSTSVWDGSVATSFTEGIGTQEDPYVISNGSEFMLLLNYINSEDYPEYFNAHYVLDANIDFDGRELNSFDYNSVFTGTIDGSGHTISNFVINSYYEDDNGIYFSFFRRMSNASIVNLNIADVSYNIEGEFEKNVFASLFAIDGENNTFSNVSINSVNYNGPENNTYVSSLFFITDLGGNDFNKIYTDFTSNFGSKYVLFKDYLNSNVGLFIHNASFPLYENAEAAYITYDVNDEGEKVFVNDSYLDDFNENEEIYEWVFENNNLYCRVPVVEISSDGYGDRELIDFVPSRFAARVSAYSLEDDSLSSLTTGSYTGYIVINDAESDYDYYRSMNYTEIQSNGALPLVDSTGRYDDNYLVRVRVVYDGKDINKNITGKISPSEAQSVIIYDKYLPLARDNNGNLLTGRNENNYVNLELIDNPFTYRPSDSDYKYGFNGWVCNQNGSYASLGITPTEGICSSSEITYDAEIYTRYLRIYTSGDSTVVIYLNASWVEAKYSNTTRALETSYGDFDAKGMITANRILTTVEGSTGPYQCNPHFKSNTYELTYGGRVNFASKISKGVYYYDGTGASAGSALTYTNSGNTYCWSLGGCEYYNSTSIANAAYNSSKTYNIRISNGGYNYTFTNDITNYVIYDTCNGYHETTSTEIVSRFAQNDITVGYYYSVGSNYQQNYLYYDKNGVSCATSGNACGSGAYKLIQYGDTDGSGNRIDIASLDASNSIRNKDKYYYLVTRDTNILEITTGTNTNLYSYISTMPFTLTASGFGRSYSNSSYILNTASSTYHLDPESDQVIENIYIQGPNSDTVYNGGTGSGVISANGHNLKIGRGVKITATNRFIANGLFALPYSNNQSNLRFKFVVESGKYSYARVGRSSTYNDVEATMITGNDIDRAKNNHADFTISYQVVSTAGASFTRTNKARNIPLSNIIVKSGYYGTYVTSSNYTNNNYHYLYGFYTGGHSNGTSTGLRSLLIEGGKVFTINGGPDVSTSYSGVAISTRIKGGIITHLSGGAGMSTSAGDRLVSITGGQITNGVNGGNNGAPTGSTTSRGPLNASTLVYVGGHSKIGTDAGAFDDTSDPYGWFRATWYSIPKGSVFGAGLGNSSTPTSGHANNSRVLIDKDAIINGDVYGGGNYGFTGGYNTSTTATTRIDIYGGTVNGSVYGGANYGGFSGSGANGSTITINVYDGNINKLYGGSNGINITDANNAAYVYGDIQINLIGGTLGSVYGGGYGFNTYTTKNITVNTQTSSNDSLNVTSIYGGSSFGKVNGTAANDTYKTIVNIGGGTITNVYGGGEGSAATDTTSAVEPKVYGDVIVNVNSGKLTNVFGANNMAGMPEKKIEVYINNGSITNAFGGGNSAPATVTYIYLRGGNVGSLFGGSNLVGVTTTSNVHIEGGTAGYIYGGNNAGTSTTTANVTVTGGTYTEVYGCGYSAPCTDTNVNIYGGSITSVFGGGNQAAVNNASNVYIHDGTHTNVYGGSNTSGVVSTSNVYINNGVVGSAYGGGNKAAVNNSNLTILGGQTTNGYGGGEAASINNGSNVSLNGGTVTNLYGGSNESGNLPKSNILLNAGSASNVYGGNNRGGSTVTTNIVVCGSNVTNVFGGGNEASSTTSNIDVLSNTGIIDSLFGGGNKASVTTSNINLQGGTLTNVYGGSNLSGEVQNSFIKGLKKDAIRVNVTNTPQPNWNNTEMIQKVSVTLYNQAPYDIGLYDVELTIPNSTLYSNYNFTTVTQNGENYHFNQANKYYGINVIPAGGSVSFDFEVKMNQYTEEFSCDSSMSARDSSNNDISKLENGYSVTNLYGGNNQGGSGTNANIDIATGIITNLYGGGNEALLQHPVITVENGVIGSLFGGGNNANVNDSKVTITGGVFDYIYGGGNNANVLQNTILDVENAQVNENIFGGGNQGVVKGNTNVSIKDASILKSTYAGGNGSAATVEGNTNITVSGNTIIGNEDCTIYNRCGLFGGGNAAYTGLSSTNNSKATVNIAGALIYGNVYGGANTSVVYGGTYVNIGSSVPNIDDLGRDEIYVRGTVFGGGESNAEGSPTYTFSFKSVTKNIEISIDGKDYVDFYIAGSVFGSGNASETMGTSTITIKNYGTLYRPRRNVSIQRTNLCIIDNSTLELSGITDSTNEYSDVYFTLSRIDELQLKNNSTLYLQYGANLLKKFDSLTKDGELAKVEFADDGSFTRNVNNRIYMYSRNNNVLNIATNENVTAYGEVSGMTFFGTYKKDNMGEINLGMYSDTPAGGTLNLSNFDTDGTYVMGLHKENHDLEVDGFYTNYLDEESVTNKPYYIIPDDKQSTYYRWVIGEVLSEYNVDLTASKYSTLGSYELPFVEYNKPNTSFIVVGFDYSELEDGVTLINRNNIPRVASSSAVADKTIGLSMEASNVGWLTTGSTDFISNNISSISGVTRYVGENSANVPTMLFYLHHSKNLSESGSLGTAKVIIQAVTKIDDLTSEIKRLVVNVNMNRAIYTTNNYEGAITPGRKYNLFTTTTTNITSKSSFTSYYALFLDDTNSIYKNGYKHSLVSSYVFPENTKITMLDLKTNEYYYKVINASDVAAANSQLLAEGDISYDLSMFEVMGTSGGGTHYDENVVKNIYYDSSGRYVDEEFIFIVDFEDTNIAGDQLNNNIFLELQSATNETVYGILDSQASNLIYSLYDNDAAMIDIDGVISKSKIYAGENFTIDLLANYTQASTNGIPIFDTKKEDEKVGIKLSLINSSGEVVTGTSLLGWYYEIDGVRYDPNIDGTTRIKISDKVGNIEKWVRVITGNSALPTGNYILRVESYSSPDGIYYGLQTTDQIDYNITIVNEIYGLKVDYDQNDLVLDSASGTNIVGDNTVNFKVEYNSGLTNPNIHVKLYRRNYDEVYDTDYTLVNLLDYFDNELDFIEENNYILINSPAEQNNIQFNIKENILVGTYKLEFILYDDNTPIGSVEKYFIVK